MEDNIKIKAENITKEFKIYSDEFSVKKFFVNGFKTRSSHSFKALNDVSFEVNAGDFFGIIGRNGSGKSTLLKILASIYEQDSGKVHVDGKIIPFLELGVGFNPELSARENIYLNGVILGMSRKTIEQRFDEIVDFAEIREFLDMPIKNFSSGMNVRLAFSIAIQAEGDIYILDEVLAVGDAPFQEKCIAHLEGLMEQGKTIIFVSHAMDQIRTYCNKVLYLKHGEVRAIGDANEMCDLYDSEN